MTEGKIENPVEAFNTGEWFFNAYFAEFGDYYIVHALREQPEESDQDAEENQLVEKLVIQ